MSYFVGNVEDRISHNTASMVSTTVLFSIVVNPIVVKQINVHEPESPIIQFLTFMSLEWL